MIAVHSPHGACVLTQMIGESASVSLSLVCFQRLNRLVMYAIDEIWTVWYQQVPFSFGIRNSDRSVEDVNLSPSQIVQHHKCLAPRYCRFHMSVMRPPPIEPFHPLLEDTKPLRCSTAFRFPNVIRSHPRHAHPAQCPRIPRPAVHEYRRRVRARP